MKKTILIIFLLVAVVALSGCTFNTTSNKTYSANGVSFTYPGTGYEVNITDNDTLAEVEDKDTFHFSFSKVTLESGETYKSLNDWAAASNKTLKNELNQTYITEKKFTVDGNEAIMIAANGTEGYRYYVLLFKNNTGYLGILKTDTSNQQLFDQIFNSLKIN